MPLSKNRIPSRLARRMFLTGCAGFPLAGQEAGAARVIEEMQNEAQQRSRAYDYAFRLTDATGPRLTGSPGFRQAAQWASAALSELGLSNVRLMDIATSRWSEPAWSYRRFGVRLVEPVFDQLPAIPAPYSPATGGRVAGDPVFFLLPGRSGLSADQIIAKFRGQLKGKILLVHDGVLPLTMAGQSTAVKLSDDELRALRNAPAMPPPAAQPEDDASKQDAENEPFRKLFGFLREEGVLAFLAPTRGGGGMAMATGALGRPGLQPPPPPGFNLPPEGYNRVVRLLKRGLRVKIEVELESEFLDAKGHTTVLAELTGAEKASDIVLVGAHLDSWHVGTGATDNAASCAILLEAMRILKTIGRPLKRTIRLALWAGHERGVQGSAAYIRTRPPGERHHLYFNLDGGAGRVRGLQIQGRREWLTMADEWLSPFAGTGQNWVSMRKSVGSDQYSFDRAGLDNIVFLQDPGWNARTYHSNLDVLDYVAEQDLKDSAAVVAAVLYRAANQ